MDIKDLHVLETALCLRNGPFNNFAAIEKIIKSPFFLDFKELEIKSRRGEWEVLNGVSGNTFRVFRSKNNYSAGPSAKYRALWKSQKNIKLLDEILKNNIFEERLEKKIYLAHKVMGEIQYRPGGAYDKEKQIPAYIKLIDLSLKSFAIHINKNYENLDVPLDAYSLQPLSSKIKEKNKNSKNFLGPSPYSMGSVRTVENYQWLQKTISKTYNPFDYDMVTWNLAHLKTHSTKGFV